MSKKLFWDNFVNSFKNFWPSNNPVKTLEHLTKTKFFQQQKIFIKFMWN